MFQIFVIAVERRSCKAHGVSIVELLCVVLKGAGISLQQGPALLVEGPLLLFVALDAIFGARLLGVPIVVLFALGLSLVLHAPVLEPHLDLPFGQVQQGRYFHPPRPAQILVEVELLLQFQ